MIRATKKRIGEMSFIGKILTGVLTGLIVIVASSIGARCLGWVSDIESAQAAEEARAAISGRIDCVEADMKEMGREHDEDMKEINDKIDALSNQMNRMAGAVEFMARKDGYIPTEPEKEE